MVFLSKFNTLALAKTSVIESADFKFFKISSTYIKQKDVDFYLIRAFFVF